MRVKGGRRCVDIISDYLWIFWCTADETWGCCSSPVMCWSFSPGKDDEMNSFCIYSVSLVSDRTRVQSTWSMISNVWTFLILDPAYCVFRARVSMNDTVINTGPVINLMSTAALTHLKHHMTKVWVVPPEQVQRGRVCERSLSPQEKIHNWKHLCGRSIHLLSGITLSLWEMRRWRVLSPSAKVWNVSII